MPDAPGAGYGTPLTQEQVGQLDAYRALLLHWNRFANLISRADERRIDDRHLKDSLRLMPVLDRLERSQLVADVGSGGGLPGVPLAIASPARQVTLIERSAKKARFLEQTKMELSLPNVDVVCDDVANVTTRFDVVVSRAVMAPERLWPIVRGVLHPGGHFAALDRVRSADDEEPVEDAGPFQGGIVVERSWSRMPDTGVLHGLLVVRCEAS